MPLFPLLMRELVPWGEPLQAWEIQDAPHAQEVFPLPRAVDPTAFH